MDVSGVRLVFLLLTLLFNLGFWLFKKDVFCVAAFGDVLLFFVSAMAISPRVESETINMSKQVFK